MARPVTLCTMQWGDLPLEVQIQLRSATSQCVLHEKTTAGLPSGRGA